VRWALFTSLWPRPTLLDWVGEGGRAGEPVRGEGTSSSTSGSVDDVGDCTDEFDGTRLAIVEPARLLGGLESRFSPLIPSSDAKALAEARGLSVAFSGFAAVPGIFDRIVPLKDFEDPCVSDLLKDGYDCSVSDGLFRFVVEPFLGVPPPVLLCWFPILPRFRSVGRP
jgi:hypothetical protein